MVRRSPVLESHHFPHYLAGSPRLGCNVMPHSHWCSPPRVDRWVVPSRCQLLVGLVVGSYREEPGRVELLLPVVLERLVCRDPLRLLAPRFKGFPNLQLPPGLLVLLLLGLAIALQCLGVGQVVDLDRGQVCG